MSAHYELIREIPVNTVTPQRNTSTKATSTVTSLDQLREEYTESFNRPYDRASGLRLERVLDIES